MIEQSQMSATSIVALFKTTKAERASFANQIIEAVDSGYYNPIDIHLQLKCMEDIIEVITSNEVFRAKLLEQVEKNGKGYNYDNAKIEVKEVGVKYNFEKCNDRIMNDILFNLNKWSELKKDREKLLKGISTSMVTVEETTGEVCTIYPPSKTSTTSVAVTLK